ncbi:MAG: hypothetical protein ACRDOM_02670 [Nocardioides sp.]
MSMPAVQLRSRMPKVGRGLAGAAVERARLTVVPRRRTRAARMPFVMLVSLVLLGGVIGLLLFNTSMQQASFAASALEQQASTLTAREQTLKMELEMLRNPQRVAEQARKLGMVPASNPAFLDLQSGRVLGKPATATRLNSLRIKPQPPALPASLHREPIVHRVVAAPATSRGSTDDRDTTPASAGNGGERDRNDHARRTAHRR